MKKNGYTRALREFENGVLRARRLRSFDVRLHKDPPLPDQQIAADALRGGAVVLMVASLEQYLKAALFECVEMIANQAGVTTHVKLEARFVEYNDLNFINWIIRESRFERGRKVAELKRVAKEIANDRFLAESFNRTRSNPGPDTVAELLKEFGIRDPFTVIEGHLPRHYKKPFIKDFAKLTLEAIVTRRNEIAHGASALNTSRVDLQNWIEFLMAFAKSADNTLRDHTRSVLAALR